MEQIAKNNEKIHTLKMELQKKELECKLLEQENKFLKEENALLKQIVNHPPPYDFPIHMSHKGTAHRILSPFETAKDSEIDRLNKQRELEKKAEKEKQAQKDAAFNAKLAKLEKKIKFRQEKIDSSDSDDESPMFKFNKQLKKPVKHVTKFPMHK